MPAKDMERRRLWQREYMARRRRGLKGHVPDLPPRRKGRTVARPAVQGLGIWMAHQRERVMWKLDAMEQALTAWREQEPDGSRDKLIKESYLESRNGIGMSVAAPALK
jgi:hypothetical protein